MSDLVDRQLPEAAAIGRTRARSPLGRSSLGVALVVTAAAVLADAAIRSRGGGLAAMAAVVVLCGGLGLVGWVARPGGRGLLVGAALTSVFLFVRTSPWLLALDLMAIALMFLWACSVESGARSFDSRFSVAAMRLWSGIGSVCTAAPATFHLLGELLPDRSQASRRRLWSLARGLVIAVPILVILGATLASADPVFASLLHLDVDLSAATAHAVVLVVAAWIATGLFVQATRPPVARPPQRASIGVIEALVVMTGLICVYAVFAFSQVLVARRGPAYVQETTGLTYAEYARSGFFQLLWVATLTALTLLVLRSFVRPTSGRVRVLVSLSGAVAGGLTLVVVHAALLRLHLYEQVFGLTRLRFYSSAFAWWLGAVFVVLALSFALNGLTKRDWLPTAIGLTALAAAVTLNVINPDHVVIIHNLDRLTAGEDFDVDYALTLSDDAVPALADGVSDLGDRDRARVRSFLCFDESDTKPTRWSLAAWSADTAVSGLCD